MSKGTLFVLSAPSGAGKTTLARLLQRRLKRRGIAVEFSVSYTTRSPRPSETAGKDYYFVADDEFSRMADNGELIEYAEVFGHKYGTGREATEQLLSAGRNLIMDIDWQGAEQIRQNLRRESISVFILPPSVAVLRERLSWRGQDSDTVIQDRMARAIDEIAHYQEFDYLVVNDELERAAEELEAICLARSMRTPVQEDRQAALLKKLLSKG